MAKFLSIISLTGFFPSTKTIPLRTKVIFERLSNLRFLVESLQIPELETETVLGAKIEKGLPKNGFHPGC